MVREEIKKDYTQEEANNLEVGKCWCGKPKAEFDKGMKVYCSKEHYREWYSRTVTWSVFKDEILDKRGKKCVECNTIPEDKNKHFQQALDEWHKKIRSIPNLQKRIQEIRIKELNELEEKYQNLMNDDYIIEHELRYELRDELGWKPSENEYEVRYEVDHIHAVALGGEMWDEKNLQILCYDCHKNKTKEDMKKLKAHRRQLQPFETFQS